MFYIILYQIDLCVQHVLHYIILNRPEYYTLAHLQLSTALRIYNLFMCSCRTCIAASPGTFL